MRQEVALLLLLVLMIFVTFLLKNFRLFFTRQRKISRER
jgi:hypothetical protein